MTCNQLTIVTVERIPVTEEDDMPIFSVIPDENIYLENGYYHGVYFLLHFMKEGIIYRKEEQLDTDKDPDEY